MTVLYGCSNDAYVELESSASTNTLQASGTKAVNGALAAIDSNNTTSFVGSGTTSTIDLNLVARDSAVGGPFDLIDMHGEYNGTSCTFWGVMTPAS